MTIEYDVKGEGFLSCLEQLVLRKEYIPLLEKKMTRITKGCALHSRIFHNTVVNVPE